MKTISGAACVVAACLLAATATGQEVGAGGASAGVGQDGASAQAGTSGAAAQAGQGQAGARAGSQGVGAQAGPGRAGAQAGPTPADPGANTQSPNAGTRDDAAAAAGADLGSDSSRAALGITLDARGDNVAIGRVLPNSPAARIGLQPGDVIVSIDGQPVRSADVFLSHVSGLDPNGRSKIVVRRNGREQAFDAHFVAWSDLYPAQPYMAMRPSYDDAPLPADAPVDHYAPGFDGVCCSAPLPASGYVASYGVGYGWGDDCCWGRPRRARRCCW
jgi:hypothetical protein